MLTNEKIEYKMKSVDIHVREYLIYCLAISISFFCSIKKNEKIKN